MGEDSVILLGRIRELVERRGSLSSAPLLAEMEHTLTDGYARALELETERLRAERRIAELAREIADPRQAAELRALVDRLKRADAELDRLRGLLAALNERAETVRAAVPA